MGSFFLTMNNEKNGKSGKSGKRQRAQTPKDDSFVGGIPKLPPGTEWPHCTVCGEPMAFFFQVAFPQGHVWAEQSMAAFRCVAGKDQIPDIMPLSLIEKGIPVTPVFDIPAGELDMWQQRFRLIGFPTASAVPARPPSGHAEFIAFRRFRRKPAADTSGMGHRTREGKNRTDRIRLGGIPHWAQEEEAPDSYGGVPMVFLLQLIDNFLFPLVPKAAKETDSSYALFLLGNSCYFFGTLPPAEPALYVVFQN